MIETAFIMGVLPQQMYDMELWEFNACIKAYNKEKSVRSKLDLMMCWHMANFSGAAFAGKLKKLSHYIKDDTEITNGRALTDDEMRELDEKIKARGGKEHVT